VTVKFALGTDISPLDGPVSVAVCVLVEVNAIGDPLIVSVGLAEIVIEIEPEIAGV
jgi:hypothetical protein